MIRETIANLPFRTGRVCVRVAPDFAAEFECLGLKNSPGFVHEPETNGVIERFFKTLELGCLWAECFKDVEQARRAISDWIESYNDEWPIERHGHRTPREVRDSCGLFHGSLDKRRLCL